MGEVFRMVYHDSICVDDALTSVVREDVLRHKPGHFPKLQRLVLPSKPGASKRAGDKGADKEKAPLKRRRTDGANKLKPCHQFESAGMQIGEDCKFSHDADE